MRRYLLSFLAALAVSSLLLLGTALLGLFLWFFDDPPLWFNVLSGIAIALPFPALGEFFSRRPGAARVQKAWRGPLMLLGALVLLSLLRAAEPPIPYVFAVLAPGQGLGGLLKNLMGLRYLYRWNGIKLDYVFTFLGNAALPLLFHLGWHWGQAAD